MKFQITFHSGIYIKIALEAEESKLDSNDLLDLKRCLA